MKNKIQKLCRLSAAAGLLGASVAGSHALAQEVDIVLSSTTNTWNNAGLNVTFHFFGVGGISATASSLSGTDTNGGKGLIADMSATSGTVPVFYDPPYVRAVGIDGNGTLMWDTCRTQQDFSTAQGQTVGDGTGCENAAKPGLSGALPADPPPH